MIKWLWYILAGIVIVAVAIGLWTKPPGWLSKSTGSPSPRTAELVTGPFTVSIKLTGEDKPSGEYFDTGEQLTDKGRFGWRCAFSGPGTAKAHLEGEKEPRPITEWLAYRLARVRFSGPAGEVVAIRCAPPA